MCTPGPIWEMPPSGAYDTLIVRSAKIDHIKSTCIDARKVTGLDLPVDDTDAVNKEYVDSRIIFDWKDPVVVATTGPQILSGSGQTIDSQGTNVGDRILVRAQTNSVDNGIYIVGTGAWLRASDLADGSQASGASVWVLLGSVYIHTAFVCDNLPNSDTVGIDPLVFLQFSSGGQVNPGVALSLTGNTLDVLMDDTNITTNGSNELTLTNTTVSPGTYGSTTLIPSFAVDAKGRITSASNLLITAPIVLYSKFRIISYATVTTLPYTLTASELLSTYIVVSVNGTGDLTLPSVTDIITEIGPSNFITDMGFQFSILKNGTNHVHLLFGTGITSVVPLNTLINADNVSNYIIVLTSLTTATILPLGSDHSV